MKPMQSGKAESDIGKIAPKREPATDRFAADGDDVDAEQSLAGRRLPAAAVEHDIIDDAERNADERADGPDIARKRRRARRCVPQGRQPRGR